MIEYNCLCEGVYPLLSFFIPYCFAFLCFFCPLHIFSFFLVQYRRCFFARFFTRFILFCIPFLHDSHCFINTIEAFFEKLRFVFLNSFSVCERSKKLTPFFYYYLMVYHIYLRRGRINIVTCLNNKKHASNS